MPAVETTENGMILRTNLAVWVTKVMSSHCAAVPVPAQLAEELDLSQIMNMVFLHISRSV